MNILLHWLDKYLEDEPPSSEKMEDTNNIIQLSPAEQAYKDYFLRRDLLNRKLNLIA